MALWLRSLVAAVGSLAIGLIAYRRGSLSGSGVCGAVLTGTFCAGLGAWPVGGALILFFVTASALSHAFSRDKAQIELDYAKGGRRDIWQALANGGVAALLCVLAHLLGRPALFTGALGALAAACADTWATELGPVFHGVPRLVTTGRPVPPGTSGGVTWQGTAAGLAGALVLGLWAGFGPQGLGLRAVLAAAAGGVVGSLADSLLGATLQARYTCPTCGRATERQVHTCGTPTIRIGGVQGFGNDLVNCMATGVGALVALALGR